MKRDSTLTVALKGVLLGDEAIIGSALGLIPRAYLTWQRHHQVMVSTPASELNNREMRDFLDSFRFVEK
ncbi:MAG: hypothetical protein AB1646_16615 [Thermodesulfobacteriota bacterium]